MTSNFAFLEKQYPELAELGKSAERNLYRDTDASSYKMGKMAEQIVNLIIIHEKIYTCGETASERIAYLWKEHLIPGNINDILYCLRTTRNLYAHEANVSARKFGSKEQETRDCAARLQMLHTLAIWFTKKYGNEKIEYKPFQVPQESDCISEAEAKQLLDEKNRIEMELKKQQMRNTALASKAQAINSEYKKIVTEFQQTEMARKRAEQSLAEQSYLRLQAEQSAQKAQYEKAKAISEAKQAEAILLSERNRYKSVQDDYLNIVKDRDSKQATLDQMSNRLHAAESLAKKLSDLTCHESSPVTISRQRYCPCCLSELVNIDEKCKCGKTAQALPKALPFNTLLRGRYVVGGSISHDDQKFVYRALDTKLKRRVTIQEFFPFNDVNREYNGFNVKVCHSSSEERVWRARRHFVQNSQFLARLNSITGIIQIYDIFEENDTAYIVFQEIDGVLGNNISGEITHYSFKSLLLSLKPLFSALDYLEKRQIKCRTIPLNAIAVKNGRFLLSSFNGLSEDDTCNCTDAIQFAIAEICNLLPLSEEQRKQIEAVNTRRHNHISDYYHDLIKLRDSFSIETINESTCPESSKAFPLTPQQEKAVKSTSNQVVVVAGPGSGKTRVITERICYLANVVGVPSSEILALSFTAKAANEMKKRISGRIHLDFHGVNIRTFHSLGLQILREYCDLLGYPEDFGIISNTEKNRYLRDILGKLGIEKREISAYSSAISAEKNSLQNKKSSVPQIDEVFSLYEEKLRDSYLVDLDDMLYKSLKLLSMPEVRHYYSSRYSHVLVDEFQDVNWPQIQMLKAIVGPNTNKFLVGDDDQCIYEWRGSKPKYMAMYASRPDQVELIKLEGNYRSESRIVALSSGFIQHNTNRIEKKMTPQRKSQFSSWSEKVSAQFFQFSSEQSQADFYAAEIKKLTNQLNYNYGDFAILVRSSKQGECIKEALSDSNIPFIEQVTGDTGYDSIIHLLHTIINVSKKGGIAKAINFPTRIIDNILFAELKENYDITGMPTQEAFGYLFGCNASFEDSDLFRSRYQFLMDLHSRYETMNVSTIIEELIASFSTERCSETNVARNNISYLYRLLEVSKEFELAHNNDSLSNDLEEFLDYLEMSLQDEHSAERFISSVNIMTCHKAKGLEFPVVFIPGVQPGVFPNDYFIKSNEQLEEERRLFYVTMTRAMDRLYVTCYNNPLVNQNSGSIITKGFIAEIPNIILEQR